MQKRIFLLFIGLHIQLLLFSQIDSTFGEQVFTNIGNQIELINNEKDNLKRVAYGFCQINDSSKIAGNEIVINFLRCHRFFKNETEIFFINNYHCLSREQKYFVSDNFQNLLNPLDHSFSEIVSIFKIHYFQEYLHQSCNSDLYENIRNSFKNREPISRQTRRALRNCAALGNLGVRAQEDSLVNLVNDLYSNLNLDYSFRKAQDLFGDILPNSIGALHSKDAVLKTLHILDSELKLEGADDYIGYDYAFAYFLRCIVRKINFLGIDVRNDNFNEQKEQLKLILTNRSSEIWKAYIRQ